MRTTELIFAELQHQAYQEGEEPVQRFTASRGPWFGWNGVSCFLITTNSLWEGRSTLSQLIGGHPRTRRWDLTSCELRDRGQRKAQLTCGTSSTVLAFPSREELIAAATHLA